MFPEDLRYTDKHEWCRGGNGATVRVGITSFAADALGDVVYVSQSQVGEELQADDACAEVESTKSVSDVYAPASPGCPRPPCSMSTWMRVAPASIAFVAAVNLTFGATAAEQPTRIRLSAKSMLVGTPETINADPYGDGWLFELEMSDPAQLDELLDSDAYAESVAE